MRDQQNPGSVCPNPNAGVERAITGDTLDYVPIPLLLQPVDSPDNHRVSAAASSRTVSAWSASFSTIP